MHEEPTPCVKRIWHVPSSAAFCFAVKLGGDDPCQMRNPAKRRVSLAPEVELLQHDSFSPLLIFQPMKMSGVLSCQHPLCCLVNLVMSCEHQEMQGPSRRRCRRPDDSSDSMWKALRCWMFAVFVCVCACCFNKRLHTFCS